MLAIAVFEDLDLAELHFDSNEKVSESELVRMFLEDTNADDPPKMILVVEDDTITYIYSP